MRKLLVAVCLLAMPCVSRAQKSNASWDALNTLRAGEKVEVVETSLKMHIGTFVAVSEETLNLREAATDQTIKKENVMRVTRLGKSHRLRNAIVFGVVGAGAGTGIGAAVHSGKDSYISRGAAALVGAVFGLAGGAAIGATVPSHDTIYRSKAN
jgi:hypothetical protein